MSFISSLNIIAKYFKVRNDKPVIDDYIFQCHYKLTTNILLIFCVLVTSINIIGNPIQCLTNLKKMAAGELKVLDTYCWISGSFTHVDEPREFGSPDDGRRDDKVRFHSYYQWVPFVLLFQAVGYYVPHWIWKSWEGGKIRMITEDMRGFSADTAKDRRARQKKLVQYFTESFHTHGTYAFGYFMCQLINAINVCANIYITDKFLGGSFLTYGTKVLRYHRNGDHSGGNRTQPDPMETTFPRLTKCDFFKYGPSGSVQKLDAMCILSQNVLNEKIYLFLWVWFFALAIVSAMALIYHTFIVVKIIQSSSLPWNVFRFTDDEQVTSTLLKKFQVGDFLLLYFIQKNVNSIQFKEIMEEICSSFGYVVNNKELYVSTITIQV